MYDYYEAVKEDILKYIEEEVDTDGIDFEELETQLYDDLFTEDSLTHSVERKRKNTLRKTKTSFTRCVTSLDAKNGSKTGGSPMIMNPLTYQSDVTFWVMQSAPP